MYPSDLTDEEWALLAPFFQRPDPRGNPGTYAKLETRTQNGASTRVQNRATLS